jgi:hypothetical protein
MTEESIKKLAKLALERPELRDELMPIIREAAWTPPPGNWVLYDLAENDAEKGKPDPMYYGKDEGYTEVYDRAVEDYKRGRRRRRRRAGDDYVESVLEGEKQLRGMSAGEIALGIYNAMGDEASYGFRSFVRYIKSNGPGAWRRFQQVSVRRGSAQPIEGPPTTQIYERKVDHGYEQPIAGGTDIMKRLQDQLLIEQGREPREKNPRLAADDPRLALCRSIQAACAQTRLSRANKNSIRQALHDYMAATGDTVVLTAATDDILEYAVGVALDPARVARIIARHTAKEQP